MKNNLTDNTVELTDGAYLINHYGKYRSDLGIIVPKNDEHIKIKNDEPVIELFKDTVSGAELNLGEGHQFNFLRGCFFKSKKGTKLFKVDPAGPHLLLRDDWGGCFNNYTGRTLPEDQLYWRRASSNGGGIGYDYAVVPVEWRKALSVEDL